MSKKTILSRNIIKLFKIDQYNSKTESHIYIIFINSLQVSQVCGTDDIESAHKQISRIFGCQQIAVFPRLLLVFDNVLREVLIKLLIP